VFGAWLNHVDSRGINSLDMLVKDGERAYIKHYMFDFGATLGSARSLARRPRVGNEYIWEWKPGWQTLGTLGFYTRPWMHIDYAQVPPSVGRFEADAFEPARWRPEYPPTPPSTTCDSTTHSGRRRIVRAISNEAIRVIGRPGSLLGSAGDRLRHRNDHQAPRQGGGLLVDSDQPGRRFRAERIAAS